MIRIEREACPSCLGSAPPEGDRYKARQVVDALWRMQHRKCCYSEMYLPDNGHGKAVEHFHPKSVFTWQRNEWQNLLLVCPQCNGKKREHFPVMLTDNEDETKVIYASVPSDGTPAIMDPSLPCEYPEEHLAYVIDDVDPLYGQVIPRNDSIRGKVTIDVTGIDDDVFLRERFDRLNETLEVQYRNLLRADKDDDADGIAACLSAFLAYVGPRAKFAGLAREFARKKRLDQRFGLDIPEPGPALE